MRWPRSVFGILIAVAALQAGVASQTKSPPADELTTGSAQQAKLVASDGAAGDRFGASVAISGDTVFVGAPAAGGTGAVYVFRRSGVLWTQVQKLTPGDAPATAEFGASMSFGTSADGDTLIVGAPGAAAGAGAAYQFARVSGDGPFLQTQKLTAADAMAGDRFGTSVSLAFTSAPTPLVIGAPSRAGGAQGAVYTYTRASALWSQKQRLTGTGGFSGGFTVREFGRSVSLSSRSDILFVGAPGSFPPSGANVGAVLWFSSGGGGVWSNQVADPGSGSGSRYGSCLAMSDLDAVACHLDQLRVFTVRGEGIWRRDPRILDAGFTPLSAAMTPLALIAGHAEGEAHVWQGSATPPAGNNTWNRLEVLKPATTEAGGFGASVALSGGTRIVGAPDAANNTGAAYVFLAFSREPLLVGFGSGSEGVFQTRADYGTAGFTEGGYVPHFLLRAERSLPWSDYNIRNGQLHPAVGDLDGDGLDEVVIGLGSGGDGYMAVFDDAAHDYALLAWIRLPWPDYNSRNGAIWPAVGDIDGDGRAEIVAGLGAGGEGFFAVFDDALQGYGFMTWRQVGWPAYNAARGETRPAVANIDGGPNSEIVIGLGPRGDGWLELFDDANGGFARLGWLRSSFGSYNAVNGETFPAAGDLDEDGYDEIVLGFGPGSSGWVEILDDAFRGFAHRAWVQVAWSDYNASNGETHPAVGNVDGDSAPEIALGLGTFASNGGWVQIVDDAARGHPLLWWTNAGRSAIVAAGAATYPAIGRLR